MKFSQMDIKLILAKILKKYDVFPANPETCKDIKIREGIFSVRKPVRGIEVIFKKKEKI